MASITQAACTEQRAAADADLPSESLLSSVQPQQPAMLPLASVLPSRDPESSGGAPAMSTRGSQGPVARRRWPPLIEDAATLREMEDRGGGWKRIKTSEHYDKVRGAPPCELRRDRI